MDRFYQTNGIEVDCNLPAPREVSFTYEGQKISPREIFRIHYEGLNQLIEANWNRLQAAGSGRIAAAAKAGKVLEMTISSWFQPAPPRISAEIVFDNNERGSYKVSQRTNFRADSLIKVPSIVYLQPRDCHRPLVLREARTYSLDDFIAPLVRKKLENKFDALVTKQFYEPESEQDEIILPKKNSSIILIPEPQLMAALERIHTEAKIRRLTPHPWVIDASAEEGKLWLLRNYLPVILPDTNVSPRMLGDYLGTLHSLGLMEFIDRQLVHYGCEGCNLVNYDPDVMTHTLSKKTIDDRERRDLESEAKAENSSLYFSLGAILREMKRSRKHLEDQGVNKALIFDYLPRRATADPFKRVELRM